MKRTIMMLSLVGAATGATAAEVAPKKVAFDGGAVEQSLTGQPGDPARGREVVGDKSLGNCVACHAISDLSDVPWHGEIGPPLDGAGERWSEAELRGMVVNAKMMFPGTMMPAFYKVDGFTRPGDAYTGEAAPEDLDPILTAQQIEDVVAYLSTLEY
ncbi:sulfur oxidation c-type cytochrome SoxX [Roseovarius sp. D22-M7]|uniref:sulfur oxidation c-type cytochrome SoxX n=1 Tax=Roseovarius sp. D22-M7 TaxID=3127116 RepID=UPI00300FC87D